MTSVGDAQWTRLANTGFLPKSSVFLFTPRLRERRHERAEVVGKQLPKEVRRMS